MKCLYCERPARDDDDFCSDDCAQLDKVSCAISQECFLSGMRDLVHFGNVAESRGPKRRVEVKTRR